MEPSTVGMSAGTARFPPAAACPDLLRARLDKRTRPVRCSRVTPACHTLAPSRLQPRRGISFQGVTILAFREETADAASPRMMMGQSQVELPVRFPHFPTAVHTGSFVSVLSDGSAGSRLGVIATTIAAVLPATMATNVPPNICAIGHIDAPPP